MSNLKKFLRKNLASVIVVVALVLIAGVAIVTKLSVSADTATTGLGAEINYADENTSVADAGAPVSTMETLAEAVSTASAAASKTATTSTTATTGASAAANAAASTTATVSASATATAAPCTTSTVTATRTATAGVSATTTTTTTTLPVGCVSAVPVTYKQGLKGEYFKDKTFTSAVLARLDSIVNFSWGTNPPVTGVPADGFSARWTGYITPKYSQVYTFKIQHNDGARLYIDNKAVINKWTNNTGTTLATDTGQVTLVANTKYPIRIDYYDNVTAAGIKLLWSSQSQAEQIVPTASLATTYNPSPANGTGNGLTGAYFNGLNFDTYVNPRIDQTVSFNWGTGIPMNGVNADNFSTVWTGQVQPKFSEVYTFYTKTSDGARLWVNGTQVINKWVDQSTPTENYGAIRLAAGKKYNIRLQYYEKTGTASSILMWSSSSQRKQIIPKTQLYSGAVTNPTATVTVTGDKLTIKKGFNTVVVGASKGLIASSSFTSKSMKVFAFNRDGQFTTRPTSALNWETNLQFMNHGIGYYVYNPGAQVDISLSYSKATEVATDQYMTTGWNLLANSTTTAKKLADVKRYFSSGCSISSTGIASCTTKGTLQSLKDLINSKKGYAAIPVIIDGNTSDATKAFNYVTVTSANIDSVTLPGWTAFWFYIFP